jgi:hypothetical protein
MRSIILMLAFTLIALSTASGAVEFAKDNHDSVNLKNESVNSAAAEQLVSVAGAVFTHDVSNPHFS